MKKIIAVIPARYASTRFPGKPLADIHGKPMIWWVYQQVIQVKKFDAVIVATDDERIENVCRKSGMDVLLTSSNHENHISRIHEVAQKIDAKYYVCINGDEPLIHPQSIIAVIAVLATGKDFFVLNACTNINDPTQVTDFSKIKIVTGQNDQIVYMSRSPIPYPRGSSQFSYKKYVGIECWSSESLDFFVNTQMGTLEKIEDIDHLRFIENGKIVTAVYVDTETLSVDTPKDLEKVRKIIETTEKQQWENYLPPLPPPS